MAVLIEEPSAANVASLRDIQGEVAEALAMGMGSLGKSMPSRKRRKVVAFLLIGRVARITRGKYRLPAFQIGPFIGFCKWMKGLRNELSKESAGGQRPLLAPPKLVHMTPAERQDAARLLAALIQQNYVIHGADEPGVLQGRHCLAATLPLAPPGN